VPALAVARALLAGKEPGSVELVGAKYGIDAALLRSVDMPVTLLPGRGFKRSFSGKAIVSNVVAVWELVSSFFASLALVGRTRPSVVVAVGGYACVAPSMAAFLFGVPVVVVNIDMVPGAANRLVSRVAKASAVAFPGTEIRRAEVTGAPVRDEMYPVREAKEQGVGVDSAKQALGIPIDRRMLAVFGGSLGAQRLNETILDLALRWCDRTDLAFFHIVGRRNSEWAQSEARARSLGTDLGGLVYVQVPYQERMDVVYEAADLFVCRAGANTVAELTVTGTPSVLVPLPDAPGDHQTANGSVLLRNGAAILITNAAFDVNRVELEVGNLLGDPQRLRQMANAARSLGRPDAAREVAALAERIARNRGRCAAAGGLSDGAGGAGEAA
jgi:UDP-N-acetylglucosamine--N-acetylmuramyl-(pentapeptide) pyrophosphoryl-undecaprenol N-acetylglucosamine transferase